MNKERQTDKIENKKKRRTIAKSFLTKPNSVFDCDC